VYHKIRGDFTNHIGHIVTELNVLQIAQSKQVAYIDDTKHGPYGDEYIGEFLVFLSIQTHKKQPKQYIR